MNNTAKILRNIAYSLIFYALISALMHSVYAIIDYNKGVLNVSVAKQLPTSKIDTGGFNFTGKAVGEIEIKPTFPQSIVLENEVFRDGGAGVVFYLLLGFSILLAIRFRLININSLDEGNVYQILVLVVFLFFGASIAGKMLMDHYVGALTKQVYTHYDSAHGFSSLYMMGLIVLANAAFQFIVYTRKLKQENDLTI